MFAFLVAVLLVGYDPADDTIIAYTTFVVVMTILFWTLHM